MRRLDRYILGEILGPLALGFMIYTFMLLIQALFKAADLIIGSGVDISTVGRLLALSTPWIVVMTIPMSLLFGILIGIGRLSADSELIAIRASGVSLFSLYRPILMLSAVMGGLCLYLMIAVLPDSNYALAKLRLEILTKSLTEEIEPRVPYTGWQGKVLYIFEAPPGEKRWKGTFVGDAIPDDKSQIIIAESGQSRAREETGEVFLSLDEAFTHSMAEDNPADYRILFQQEYNLRLDSDRTEGASSDRKRIRELSISGLRERIDDPSTETTVRNLARVEIHKRFGFPAACLVFGLLALPLGFSNVRGGRSSGFALSIVVVLVYYLIFNSGEEAAADGSVPAWLAVWLPNALLLVAGLFLLARKNRDKSLLLSGFDRWIQEHLWSKLLGLKSSRELKRKQRYRERAANRRGQADVVLRLPELRMRFPNSMDRYVLSRFIGVFLVAGMSGLSVYLIADMSDIVEDILKNEVPWSVVTEYYQYKCFAIGYEISPLIILITTLTTFGLLSRTNEIIACKALGISLYRLALPVVVAAAVIAGLAGLVESEILPAANARVTQLKSVIKGQDQYQVSRRRADRQWLYGKGNHLYNYSHFDPDRKELHGLQIFKFDDAYRLVGRLLVERATHISGPWWVFSNGWARTFEGQELTGFSTFDEEPLKYRLTETPEYFESGLTPATEMDYAELSDYIDELQEAGQRVPELVVALHNKIAYPVTCLVMALVALPFAFRLGRRGALYGIGLSLILGIVLLIVLGTFRTMGENAFLPPVVAVWSPSLIFACFSLYLFLGVRS